MIGVEKIVKSLFELEADAHEKGWDNADQILFYVHYRPPTKTIELEPVSSFEMLKSMFRTAGIPKPEVTALHEFSKALRTTLASGERMRIDPNNLPIGAGYICEAYGTPLPKEEREGREIADIPGSYEVRAVGAMDTFGRLSQVIRLRGKSPESQIMLPDDPHIDVALDTAVPRSLLNIAVGLSRSLPDDYRNLAVLNRLEAVAVDLDE